MNGNSDNHKPLSPEELFRLLETKNEGALSGDGLDDFEKEALEGFSAHTSAEKARQLTAEVHQLIHEKLDETKKQRPVGRIIWFGAAASVVLGLITSAYIITQHAKSSHELALNKEVADEMKQMPAMPAVQEPLTTVADKEQEKETKPQQPAREIAASQDQSVLREVSPISGDSKAYKEGDLNRPKNDGLAAGAIPGKSKDESKKGQGQAGKGDDLKLAEQEEGKIDYVTNGTVAANKVPAPQEDLASAVPASEKAQKESPVTTYESVVVESKVTQSLKKRKEKEAGAEKYAVSTVSGSTKTEENKGPVGNTRSAYDIGYVGDDQRVKAHVITWFKEHKYEAPKGNYNIRLKIKADGTAEVLEVKAEKNGNEKAVKPLEESLKAMKGWNPAISDQQAADSETTFTLSF